MSLTQLLQELLAESAKQTEVRTDEAFDRIAAPYQDRLVIFGTAYLGKLALSGIRAAGIEPLAFCDNNPASWETSVEGIPVLAPSAAAQQFGHSAAFVVAIYNSAGPAAQLRQLGCTRVVPYPMLFWKHWRSMPREDRLELPHRILARFAELEPAYTLLADEKSRREFCAQIRWRCLLDYSCLPNPDPAGEMYYPRDLVRLLPDEVLADCGAFDGDSIRAFLDRAEGAFGHIYALEADSGNAAALQCYRASLPPETGRRLHILPYAVARKDGVLRFSSEGFVGSRVVDSGPAVEVPCRSLDSLLAGSKPTFIKMDIEGAELEALSGAREVMARDRPIMAVCAYHKCDHLWIIPQLLRDGNPDYRIFLRRYAEDCWETVYYAVPPERLVDTGVANRS